jgi:NADH dehydrogenase [ubiquinone] 1 alpha subcomplex assembly factor 5
MTSSPTLFDRATVRRHIARAMPRFAQHSALFDDTAAQIEERLSEVKRDFAQRLDLSPFPFPGQQAGVVSSSALAPNDLAPDEEILPFAPESFDLIASNLDLHWVNDVPGILAQIRAALKPEGLFIATLIGEQSLRELRECLLEAELAVTGGISPRLSPTIDLQGASALMQRAGFTLPVTDKETVTLLYPDMFALMRDLRGMGQTNAHTERLRRPTRRTVFFEAARLYQERFGDTKGHIPATFDIIYLHGWK